MKSKSEQIYEAIGEGYGYNGSKEECIKIIEDILKGEKPVSKNFVKPDVSGRLPNAAGNGNSIKVVAIN